MSLDVLPRGKSTLADYLADKLDVLVLEAEVALVELLDGLGEVQVPEADVDGELAERIPGVAEVYRSWGREGSGGGGQQCVQARLIAAASLLQPG
jgi:hypothetical protein